MKSKIDLFGGTGFIGSRFKLLFPEETEVHDRNDDNPNYENILYMISTTHNYNVFDDPHKDIQTNLVKLISVLKNCRDKNITFNFVSSWFVYGDVKLPAKENALCNPRGFYSITKKCAEDLLISFCKTYKINYRIFRLANIYGGGDKGACKRKNALEYLIKEIKNNQPVNLYHGGDFTRDYIHVNDTCRAIKLIMDKGNLNEIYNIGTGEATVFRNIIEYVIKETGSLSKIYAIDSPEFHKLVQVKDTHLDISKIQNLGFRPEYNVYTGINTFLHNDKL